MQTLEEGVITLPTLSLWQPWASAMALGLKANETRHWPTNFRGLFAIHAAKKWDRAVRNEYATAAACAGVREAYPEQPPLGGVVAVALLTDCRSAHYYRGKRGFMSTVEAALGNYEPGRFIFVTEAVRRLQTPLPLTGRQQPFFPWRTSADDLHRAMGLNEPGVGAGDFSLESADGQMLGCLRCGRTSLSERSGVRLSGCAFCLSPG